MVVEAGVVLRLLARLALLGQFNGRVDRYLAEHEQVGLVLFYLQQVP